MTFWLVSVCILGIGLMFAHDSITFAHYGFLLFALPPLLTILENLAVVGLDNVVIPVGVIVALQLTQTH
ncbi:hypothetical protein BVY00_02545 [bacterium G20]|nr:hypothetical protein BVY00_02545 [bacterium G20]